MWTEFLLALSVIAFFLSLAAAFFAARSAALGSELLAQLQRSPLSRIESCEQRVDELGQTMLDLANSVKMQRVRLASSHATSKSGRSDEMPDPYKQPDEWRAAMNAKLARGKVRV